MTIVHVHYNYLSTCTCTQQSVLTIYSHTCTGMQADGNRGILVIKECKGYSDTVQGSKTKPMTSTMIST